MRGGWISSLKSAKRLRAEISLLEKSLEAPESLVGLDEWNRYAVPRNRARLSRAREELVTITGDLEWKFEGLGVYRDAMSMQRLVNVAQPLNQTLSWTGRDLMFQEGRPPGIDPRSLVEPVITGTFNGQSFGLRIGPPRVMEQISFAGSIFERAVSRVVAIFRAAQADEAESEIVELVSGLRGTAISGLTKLTEQLAIAGKPSTIRWQGETVITVTEDDAALLYETVSRVHPHESERRVHGKLVGGDLSLGTFHLEVTEDGKTRDYRGGVEEEVKGDLAIELGSLVNATLIVVETESQFLPDRVKERFMLKEITPVSPSK